jgi:hypothetical protein
VTSVIGCGGTKTKTVEKTVSSPGTPTETQSTATTSGVDDCTAKGITPAQGKEGACTDSAGQKFLVVNRRSTLRMTELRAAVQDVRTEKTLTSNTGTSRAKGMFLIVTLNVTNKLNQPQKFDSDQNQVILYAGKDKKYTENFDAENGQDQDSFLWKKEDIQPDQTGTGDIVFDVPANIALGYDKPVVGAELGVLNFSDASSSASSPSLGIGEIRLFR